MCNVQCTTKAMTERYLRQGTYARCVRYDCSVKRKVAGSVPRRTQVRRHTVTKQLLLTTLKEPRNACGIGNGFESTRRSRLLVVVRRLDVFATDRSGVIGKTYGESKSVSQLFDSHSPTQMTQGEDCGQKTQRDDAQLNGRVPTAGTALHDDVEDCH